ncbi:MAG: hypothetical protein IKU24_06265 [Clostridia bacterium]|nr:hypothetical protein [Clostridia bacterium]
MGTKFIFLGFLFLINPDLITLDIFPDFIGYLLIAKGLTKLSFLEERIATAKKYASYLAIVSILKLLSSTVTFTTRVESTRLTVCFVFLIAELVFSLLLCDNAFKGLQYLAIRKDGDLVLKSYDLVKTFTTIFFAIKAVANFLPQLPTVFYTNIDADPEQVENFNQMVASFRTMRSIFFVVAALVVVCFGIYTARLLKAYLLRCKEDKVFSDALCLAYEENVVKNVSFQTRIAIKNAFFWFFCGFILLGDLYLDHINMFPKPLGPLFLFFGLKKISQVVEIKKWHLQFSLVSFFVASAMYAYRLISLILNEDFPYVFPYEITSAVFTGIGGFATYLPLFFVVVGVFHVSEKFTSFSYKRYAVSLLILLFFITCLSSSQYLFVGRSDLVVWLQWIFYAVMLYLHKSSMDDIFSEAEYKLM